MARCKAHPLYFMFFIFYLIILFVPLLPPRLCSSVPHAFIDFPVPSSFHTFFSALISLIYSHFFPAFLHHQQWTVVLMKLGNATSTFSSALWTTRTTPHSAGQLGAETEFRNQRGIRFEWNLLSGSGLTSYNTNYSRTKLTHTTMHTERAGN